MANGKSPCSTPKPCPDCEKPLNVLYGTNKFTIRWFGGKWIMDEEPSQLVCGECYVALDHEDIEDILKAVDLL